MRRIGFFLLLGTLVGLGIFRWYWVRGGGEKGGLGYTPGRVLLSGGKTLEMLSALDGESTRLVGAVVPSVVSITTSRAAPVGDPLERFLRRRGSRGEQASGSGVIVSEEGHILTNHHVVVGMEKIEVELTDGRRFPAELIGTDVGTDMAVLRIRAKGLVALAFGDSDAVKVGQMVWAVGNPFGLQETVTQGIISAKGRRAMADSGVEFLQTDAAVNQGNSGGPLLNVRGEIIGINSAIFSTSKEGAWLGISFAIPSNVARRALESLLRTGRIVRGYLGVQMMGMTAEMGVALGLPDGRGVLVVEVLGGSPAVVAGLRAGDVIRRFNGEAVGDIYGLRERLARVEIGSKVELGIWRGGVEKRMVVEVWEAPVEKK
jgi:serine protease Do